MDNVNDVSSSFFDVPRNVIHLAVHYLNNFLSTTPSRPPGRIYDDHIVAAACFLIAYKFEARIRHPSIEDLIYYSESFMSVGQIVDAEFDILMTIDFQVSVVTTQLFMEWFIVAFAITIPTAGRARLQLREAIKTGADMSYSPSAVAVALLSFAARQRVSPPFALALTAELERYAVVDTSTIRDVTCSLGLDTVAVQS